MTNNRTSQVVKELLAFGGNHPPAAIQTPYGVLLKYVRMEKAVSTWAALMNERAEMHRQLQQKKVTRRQWQEHGFAWGRAMDRAEAEMEAALAYDPLSIPPAQ